MRRLLLLPVVAVLLAGCSDTIIDVGRSDPSPPNGFHTVGYHGISLDVPDDARLDQGPSCDPGLPSTGSLVVPLAAYGATSCPSESGAPRTVPPRPTTDLTVVLTTLGDRPDLGLPDPQYVDDSGTGVTVAASGPASQVRTVLASIRSTSEDASGCDDRIDPNVAPRNTPSDTLIPADVSAVAVCEYATKDTATAGLNPSSDTTVSRPTYWLVASTELDTRRVATVAGVLRSASPVDGGATSAAPFGPVLRLLVRGADGNTRTLQAVTNTQPEPVTDGQRTVGADADGYHPPIPTPFNAS